MMMKHFFQKKKNIAIFWLATYALLLLIPVLGNSYILFSVNRAIRQETESKYRYFLDSLSANIDAGLKEVNAAGRSVQESPEVDLTAAAREVTPQVIYDMGCLAKELDRIKSNYEIVSGIFVYFPLIDKIVANGGYEEPSDYFVSEYIEPNQKETVYREFLHSVTPQVLREIQPDPYGKMRPVYHAFSPVFRDGSLLYTVGVTMDEQGLYGTEINLEQDDVVIYTKRNQIYLSSNPEIAVTDLADVISMEEYAETEVSLQGERCSVSYVKSHILNYKYIFITPNLSPFTAARRSIAVGILVSGICILIMAIVFYKLYKWNYLSIQDILRGLDEVSYDGNHTESEFDVIKRKISIAMKQQRAMDRELSSQMAMRRSEFIADLLCGRSGDENYIQEGLKKYQISFSGSWFCVSVCCIREYGIFEDSDLKQAHYVLQNMMGDMFKHECYVLTEYNGMLFLVFNFAEPIDVKEHLSQLFFETGEVAKLATGIVFTSATSELGKGLRSLPQLYESVLSTYNMGEFYGLEEHLFREDIEQKDQSVVYSAEIENELISCLNEKDTAQLERLINRLFDERMGVQQKWMVVGLAYSVLNTMRKLIEGNVQQMHEAVERLNSFHDYDNIGKMRTFILDYGSFVMEQMDHESRDKEELYDKAVAYINEHFCESDLNVGLVSERMGVTAIYLAYIVKQNSGMKLSEYIAKLRIDKAKQLLTENPELRVEDAAVQCGFWQSRTFYNTFKRHTGVTPTQYRKQNQGGRDEEERENDID